MLITNATLVTWEVENRVLEDGALLIENEISAKAREIAPKVWERYNKEVAKVY
jgi:hypothetical protein